mmetsp:Transcript_52090/g.127179  ORF Transcript_52090/g.127179 Transcript_52090/m.127179 type:complete len:250 (-) Transcript_52090:278-1027(-)
MTPGRWCTHERCTPYDSAARRAAESCSESSFPSLTHTTKTLSRAKYCSACCTGHQSKGSSALTRKMMPSACLRSAVETMSAISIVGPSIISSPASSVSEPVTNTSSESTIASVECRSSQLFSRDSHTSALPSSSCSSLIPFTRKGNEGPIVSRCSRMDLCKCTSCISSSLSSCLKCTSTVAAPAFLHRYHTVTRSLYGQSDVSIPSIALTMLRFIVPADPARKSFSCEPHSFCRLSYALRWHFVRRGSS